MRTSSIRAALLLLGATALFTAGCGDDDTPMEDGGPVTDGGRDGGTDGGTDAGRDAQVMDDGGEDAAAPDCEEATDCEGTDTTCRFRTCVEGACGFENASARTACTEDEGSLCDGEGACVECLNVDDCGEGEVCDDTNACVPTACMNGVLDGEETDVDCGGPDCGPCGVGDACLVASDCESRFCDESGDSPVCAACGSDDDCSGDDWCDVENERCEPTTCAAESCAVAPMAICSEGAAITYEAAGTCTSPGGVVTCEHAVATTTDCAAADQACVEGACVDPCATTTCDAPPAADCVDPSTRRTYATTGVCASPGGVATCTYEATTTTCEGTTSCLEGVCVDGCDGVSCAVAPAPECIDGTTLRTFTAPGTCGIDEGTPSCTFPSTTTDCADGVPGGTCAAGACVDPCATVTCDAPPPDDCDDTSRRTYAATGTCSAGTCTYEPTLVENCADVPGGICAAAACVNACTTNPCTDATSFCVDHVVTTQVTPGTCTVNSAAEAECAYATMAGVDCTTLDQQCSAGACIDPCEGTACDTPPGDFCDTDGFAVTHAGGVCTSPGGVITCSYPETRVDCPGAGLACVGAACVDLCEGVSCDTLPPPTCVDEDTERVAAASGSCTPSTGDCSFMMMDVTCDSGSTCVEGQGCVVVPLTIAACRLQWPPTVEGEAGTIAGQMYGRVIIPGYTDVTVGNEDPQDPRVVGQFGFGDTADAPETWTTWATASPNPGYGGEEANADEFWFQWRLPNDPGAYDYAYRFSGDGGLTWTYCDFGAGSTNGYDPTDAGKATVTEIAWTFVETFDNRPTLATNTYGNFAFDGVVPPIEWNVVHGRQELNGSDDYSIDGAGVLLRRAQELSSASATFPNGIGSLAFDVRKAFSGNAERRLEVLIGSEIVASLIRTFPDGISDEVVHVRAINLDVSGPATVTIRIPGTDATNRHVVIDNFRWTSFP